MLNGAELQGLVIEPMNFNNNQPRTFYKFIPTARIIEWRTAEARGEWDVMNGLEQEVDILDIDSATLLSF
jgi:hypothetical protein